MVKALTFSFLFNSTEGSRWLVLFMDQTIYRKSFIFEATRYEVFGDGTGRKGDCNTTIIAEVLSPECISMKLNSDNPIEIYPYFTLPIYGIEAGDILNDRVQYGRLRNPFATSVDPREPIVCNIFNNHTCIRFAMMSQVMIWMVEFYGHFTEISNP